MKRHILASITALLCLMASFAMADLPKFAEIKSVSASVTLDEESSVSYKASNLLDENPATVWAATFEGEPMVLTFDLDSPTRLAGFYIENGYWKNQMALMYNSRAKDMTIYLDGEKLQEVVLDDVKSVPTEYALGTSGQYVSFVQNDKEVSQVKLEISSVYAGSKWKDLVVSTVRFTAADVEVASDEEEEIFHDNGGAEEIDYDDAEEEEPVVGEAEMDGDPDESEESQASGKTLYEQYAAENSCKCEEWTLCECELNTFWKIFPFILLALVLIPAIVGFFVPALSGYRIIGIVISVVLIILIAVCGGPTGLVLKVANIFLTIAKIVTYAICFGIAAIIIYIFKGGDFKSSSGSVSITGYSISGSTLYVKVEDSNGHTSTISKTVAGEIYDVVCCGRRSIDIRITGGGSKGFKLKGSSASNCYLS